MGKETSRATLKQKKLNDNYSYEDACWLCRLRCTFKKEVTTNWNGCMDKVSKTK